VSLQLSAEFHVSTAFLQLRLRFVNTATHSVTGLFALPTRGTVTSAMVQIGESRVLETVVVANGDVAQLVRDKDRGAAQEAVIPNMDPPGMYVADLFRLPVAHIEAGEQVEVAVEIMETLELWRGRYAFSLPLAVPPQSLPQGVPLSEIFQMRCVINSMTPQIDFESDTHTLDLVARPQPNTVVLGVRQPAQAQTDFRLFYAMPSPQILGGLLVEPPAPLSADPRGSFLLHVTPPTQALPRFRRNIIFVVDRSGSMTGEPYAQATRALGVALDGLGHGDSFNIVSFDDLQEWMSPAMVPYSEAAVGRAKRFLEETQPRGQTDILTPLQDALQRLNALAPVAGAAPAATNTVVLVTDGAVAGERIICKMAMEQARDTRILTVGIGKFCNWYFLKMLALVGRGFNTTVMYKEQIYDAMVQLMDKTAAPVLTDVSLLMQVQDCELYPFPIPDLFAGGPLAIAGKFNGPFPAAIVLQGRLADGQPFQQQVVAAHANGVPVGKVFLKQRIELLTARQWLTESKELEEQIVQISVANSFPSAFTSMVAYETTVEKKRQQEQQQQRQEEEEKKEAEARRASSRSKANTAAALAVGGAFVVGAGIFAFGDVGATMAGIASVGSAGVNLVANVLASGCCTECLNLVTCGGCGFCGDVCSGFCKPAIEAVGGCCEGCCGTLGGCLGSACGGLGGCCGSVCAHAGACCGAVSGWVGGCLGGGCCDCLGDAGSGLLSCLGGAFKLISGLVGDCGGLGDCC
jgi:hypothetical protein